MSAHTKGPWKISGAWITGKYGEPICQFAPASLLPGSIIELEANQALLISAPDLLEALEYVAKHRGEVPTHIADVCTIALHKAKG